MPDTPPKSFMADHSGKPSSMRLMSVLSLLMSSAIALLIVLGKGSGDHSEFVLYFLAGAFAPKAVQSFAEHK